MKLKFIAYHEDGSKTIKTLESVYLPEVIRGMHEFLKGCGFIYEGELDVAVDVDTEEG